MKNYLKYQLTDAEMRRVQEVNGIRENQTEKDLALPKCKCELHGTDKPSHCRQGPLLGTWVPGCSYSFDGEKRIGNCSQCGRCCSIPRKDGDPFGFYSPLGKACKHLKVED